MAIGDALEAPDQDGVDPDLVEQAAAAFDAGDLRRTRDLLQSAIGAGPYFGTGVPEPVREGSGEPGQPAFAVAGESGTTVVLDAYEPDTGLNGGEWILLAMSVVALAGGVLMSWWLRPADSVRQLRRATRSGQA